MLQAGACNYPLRELLTYRHCRVPPLPRRTFQVASAGKDLNEASKRAGGAKVRAEPCFVAIIASVVLFSDPHSFFAVFPR